jgi:hypothetical protein
MVLSINSAIIGTLIIIIIIALMAKAYTLLTSITKSQKRKMTAKTIIFFVPVY